MVPAIYSLPTEISKVPLLNYNFTRLINRLITTQLAKKFPFYETEDSRSRKSIIIH
jgi:hypothetical protein